MVARQESQDEDEAGAQQLGLVRLDHEPEDPESYSRIPYILKILNFKTSENILDFLLTCHLETSGIIFNPGGSAESDHSLRILPIEN